ncbi:hypothetical protein FRB99_004283 [Tulasnella sp. 403]|nr:hypothetical protein FRB99_004283 [Tulasnella sp. 403]
MDGDGSDQEEAALRVLEDAFGKLEPFEDWCTDCESSPVIATIDKHLEDMAEIRRKFGWPSMEEEQEEARKRQKEKEALDARFLPDIDHWTDEEYDDEEVTELASNPHERVDRSSSVGKATRGKGKEVAHD